MGSNLCDNGCANPIGPMPVQLGPLRAVHRKTTTTTKRERCSISCFKQCDWTCYQPANEMCMVYLFLPILIDYHLILHPTQWELRSWQSFEITRRRPYQESVSVIYLKNCIHILYGTVRFMKIICATLFGILFWNWIIASVQDRFKTVLVHYTCALNSEISWTK